MVRGGWRKERERRGRGEGEERERRGRGEGEERGRRGGGEGEGENGEEEIERVMEDCKKDTKRIEDRG